MRKGLRADMGFEVRRALRASEREGVIKNALTQGELVHLKYLI